MTAEILHFPPVGDRAWAHADLVATRVCEIMTLIGRVTQELYDENDLPLPLRQQLVLQMQSLAVDACAINLIVADHVAVPPEFTERIADIVAKLESA